MTGALNNPAPRFLRERLHVSVHVQTDPHISNAVLGLTEHGSHLLVEADGRPVWGVTSKLVSVRMWIGNSYSLWGEFLRDNGLFILQRPLQ